MKVYSPNIRLAWVSRKSIAVVFLATLIGYLIQLVLIDGNGSILKGNTVIDFKSGVSFFPIFWYWLLMWTNICIYPIVARVYHISLLQMLLRMNSRIRFWTINYIFFVLLAGCLNAVLLSILRIFSDQIDDYVFCIFVGGSMIMAGVFLLATLKLGVRYGLIGTLIFPFVGINVYTPLLPANFLIPIRVELSHLGVLNVLEKEFLFLIIFFVLGCVLFNSFQFYHNRGAQYE